MDWCYYSFYETRTGIRKGALTIIVCSGSHPALIHADLQQAHISYSGVYWIPEMNSIFS